MQLAKWGDDFAVRLPKEMVEALAVELGEELDVRIQNGSLRIRRKRTRADVLESLKRFQGWMPEDFKFDREEANAR
ncbi:AbrB/MazE/SpoVT family DNA-binding domain-containing protein [Sphingomonas sp. 10B4]|uniref:AbrB/MazE/SpoVT family DNA-binding domain-containing protein n=1 Tax=Sphingomonas sp. 10B4 TaxID=3048575 RepID=UPI002AB3A4AC|nr:AbrB/MazE/SpoVT family DNA-binding domain-containing protein [Sphingomonas sp. 10B4]MDY7524660.1 AbrB/MazE/SpoVT family DNA-binding domain-containing protein [Sphingomonas sp. 10B4]MEB0284202.1 AbrB/MazE/SpoVT family DNA-binding domain-containing protein [Sphingomonas sp. 10B4]